MTKSLEVTFADDAINNGAHKYVYHRFDESGFTLGETVPEFVPPPPQFDWGGLYPHESSTRDRKCLDGIWNFRISPRLDFFK